MTLSLSTLTTSSLAWEIDSPSEMFPVVYSILSPHALVSMLETHYDLGQVQRCQFWHRGLSDVYLVDIDHTPYILRVSHHHWRSQSEIGFELEFLDFLHRHQLPIAYPLKTKQNKLFIEIKAPEGQRYLTLFTYAHGTVALGDFTFDQSQRLGNIVAQIHHVSDGFKTPFERQPLTLDHLLDDSLAIIVPFLQPRPQELQDLLAIATQIKERLANLPVISPYWSVCWGDPHSGNVHITENHQMTLFDFDQCGYGWRMFDVAKFFQVSMQSGLNRKVRTAFLQGYQEITPITDQEQDCLQTLTQTAYIWSWAISLNATRFYDYCRLDNGYFRQRLERLKSLISSDWLLF